MSAAYVDILRHLRSVMAKQATGALSDRQLLESILNQRSEAAFTALVQRHGAMVLGVCRRLLRHAQDAEDAFQATFLALAQQAASIHRQESVGSWLHGVACRIAAKMKRTAARRIEHEGRLPPRPPRDAMDDITSRELRAVLDEELRLLPVKYRAPLVLCYLEAQTQDEATRQLGWSKSTFGRRLNRARQLLARRLTRRGLTLPTALTAPLFIDSAAAATVPPLLAANTVRAGLALASGQPIGALASASVVALAESGGQVLLASKAKWALALMVAVSGVLTHQTLTTKSTPPPPQSPPARSASKDDALSIKGRVLGPDGKPYVGAKVYLWTNAVKTKAKMQVRATTGTGGRFRFPIREEDHCQAIIIAMAADHGPDWTELAKLNKGEEATLRLAKDDVPIQGRILNLEGRPVANATVRVLKLDPTDLDWWLKEVKRGWWFYPPNIPEALAMQVTTGPDGRFQLRGLGRERLVYLEISGETIERARCWVLTRAKDMPDLPKREVYTARFWHIAGPTKPIIGTVREKGTNKPLAGITVQMDHHINHATTDEHGRYRIIGNAKQPRGYGITAAGRPYFAATQRFVADTPGLEPLVVDFALERGIEIRGRVFNKATGKPIQGKAHVLYHAFADNPYLNKVSTLDHGDATERIDGRNDTVADGSFFVVGLPGPGLLTVLADEDDFLKPERPADWKKLVPGVNSLPPLVHAWVPINPSEKDPKSTQIDIALEPAKSIDGQVHDSDGKPLGGYFVAGLTGSPKMLSEQLNPHADAAFQVRGLDPGRPRPVVFLHPVKKLGKVIVVHQDQRDPLQVRLQLLSAATGRILDAEGRPRADLQVRARPYRNFRDDAKGPTAFQLEEILEDRHLDPQTTSDARGRFRLNGLIPGLNYILEIREGDKDSPIANLLDNWAAADPGKIKDLGDLKSKRTSDK
jgi:RNA polymerase sigma factor (sigma-70 family)